MVSASSVSKTYAKGIQDRKAWRVRKHYLLSEGLISEEVAADYSTK